MPFIVHGPQSCDVGKISVHDVSFISPYQGHFLAIF